MAADLGGETAMNELGLCYEHGLGVPLCEDKAFEWISKAVENGAGACAEHGYKINSKTQNYDSR